MYIQYYEFGIHTDRVHAIYTSGEHATLALSCHRIRLFFLFAVIFVTFFLRKAKKRWAALRLILRRRCTYTVLFRKSHIEVAGVALGLFRRGRH